MSKKRGTLSWFLSIGFHTLLAFLILREGYRAAFPIGSVTTDAVSFEVAGGQTPPKQAAPKVVAKADSEMTDDRSEVAMPAKAKAKEKAPKITKTEPKQAAPKAKALPERLQPISEPQDIVRDDSNEEAAEAPAKKEEKIIPPPPMAEQEQAEQSEEPEQKDTEAVAPAPAAPSNEASNENSQANDVAENGQGDPNETQAGNAPTGAPTQEVIPQYGTPGTMIDESRLQGLSGNQKPRYPYMARLRRLTGTTVIRAYITSDGRVNTPIIEKSAGYAGFDEAAMEAFVKWRYKPGPKGWLRQPFVFNIK